MEGVGARLGRSSSRYGTTTVFSGPVRKWKKDWVPIAPSSSSSSSNTANHHHHHHHHPPSSSSLANGGSSHNGNNGSVSHLRLFKWTPVSQSNNKDNSNNNNNNNHSNGNNGVGSVSANGDCSPSKDSNKDDVVSEEPPRRKFKYIPIAMLEEQKKETEENTDDEAKPADADENTAEQASKSDGRDEKPDINDVPMEETQASDENETAPGRQDLNESLDLSLGLTSLEEEHDSDSKAEPTREDGEKERPSSDGGAA